MINKPCNVVLYCRVSTEEQTSIKAQFASRRRYCEAMGHTIVGVYHDKQSAKSIDRPGFNELIAKLEDPGVDAVVITHIDRLTRSLRDWTSLVDEFFSKDVGLICPVMNIDTRTPAGRGVLNIIMCFAQMQRESISENTKRALDWRRDRGLITGNTPYGLMRASVNSNKLIVQPTENLCLNYMQTRRSEGASFGAIARELNDLGYRNRKSNPFTHNGIASTIKSANRRNRLVDQDYDVDAFKKRSPQARYDRKSISTMISTISRTVDDQRLHE